MVPGKIPIIFSWQLEGINAAAKLRLDGTPLVLMYSGVVCDLVGFDRLLFRCFEPGCDNTLRREQFRRLACPVLTKKLPDKSDTLLSLIEDYSELFKNSLLEPFGLMNGTQLLDWQGFFILCHELAHHILRHLDSCAVKQWFFEKEDLGVDILLPNWNQELQADKLAMQWCLNTLNEMVKRGLKNEVIACVPWAPAAPDILLQILAYLEVEMPNQMSETSTHPPAHVRRLALLKEFEREIKSWPFATELISLTERLFTEVINSQ